MRSRCSIREARGSRTSTRGVRALSRGDPRADLVRLSSPILAQRSRSSRCSPRASAGWCDPPCARGCSVSPSGSRSRTRRSSRSRCPRFWDEFDVGITTVAWVLTSFNLVLALVAVPAALLARRRPREAFVAGAVVFAAASLACGLAASFELLVAARCVQAVGAAFVVVAALDLLAETTGSDARAARIWVAAGVLGAAFGPGAGGILTELLGWESIFLVQVPLALVPLVTLATWRHRRRPSRASAGRPTSERQCRAALPLRRSRRCALPPRAPARDRLGHVSGGGRPRRHGAAAGRDRVGTAFRRARSASALGWPAASSSSRVACRRSRSCRAPAGCGRSLRRSSWERESASHSPRSPREPLPAAPSRSCTAAGRSPHGTPASCSACCCSHRCSPPRSSDSRDEAVRAGTAAVLDSRIPRARQAARRAGRARRGGRGRGPGRAARRLGGVRGPAGRR